MPQVLQSRLRVGYFSRVPVPKGFRVGAPTAFESFVWTWGSAPFKLQGLEGKWVRLSGGPLPVNVLVRIDRAEDGRFMITGLLIGLHSRREITWETLRQIRPASLLGYLFSDFDPRNPRRRYVETDPFAPSFDEDDLPAVDLDSNDWREHQRVSAAYQLWREAAAALAGASPDVESVTKPRASVATNLTRFAEVYLRHVASTPRRATTATAEELHISRATAIRRIAECRDTGLIPPRSQS